MVKTSAILLCSLLLAFTVQVSSSSLRTTLNAFASTSEEVPLHKDANGFYVEVDLKEKTSSTEDVAKMLLGISQPQTLFAKKCLGLDGSNIKPEKYNWKLTDPLISYSKKFPYFSASVVEMNAQTFLSYSNWELRDKVGIIQDGCEASKTSTYGAGRAGILGLAVGKSFVRKKVFSFDINKDLSSGRLLFKFDPFLAAGPSTPLSKLITDEEWKVSFNKGSVVVGSLNITFSGKVMFDVHADAVGLPHAFFTGAIAYFNNVKKLACSDSNYQPTCSYDGSLNDLPIFIIKNEDKNLPNYIEIPPEVYVKDSNKGTITLNLKALSPSLDGRNYVTDEYKDHIILDTKFMSYRYVTFEKDESEYIVKIFKHLDTSANSTFYLTFGIPFCIFMVWACWYSCCRKLEKSPPISHYTSGLNQTMNQPMNQDHGFQNPFKQNAHSSYAQI